MPYDLAGAKELLIVGGGVTGCVAAHVFSRKGWKVTLFDDHRPLAGSRVSAGIIHSAWVDAFDPEEVRIGLLTLRAMFDTKSIVRGKDTICRVRPSKWFKLPEDVTVVKETVGNVGNGWVAVNGKTYVGKVYVATGCWANELLPTMPKIDGRIGTAVYWSGHYAGILLEEWAPYKQLMMFEQDDGVVWTGDGTAIKPCNYTDNREQQTVKRVSAIAGKLGMSPIRAQRGIRPYLKGVTGYYDKPMTYLWVSTAGSKSGTIWAAITARRLWEEIGR